MLLFSRTATLTGSPRRTVPWAMAITDYVNANGALPISCWSATFGLPIGTVVWSARVDSQAQLAAATGLLLTDSGYLDLLEEAADFVTTPGHDLLREVVYGTAGDPPPMGAVVTLTTATAMVDRLGDTLAWSVDIARYIEGATGSPVRVAVDKFGQMGGIAWLSIATDTAAAEAAAAKLSADSTYVGRLSATKDLFIPGSGHTAQAVRIA